jgi:hypothetical protein
MKIWTFLHSGSRQGVLPILNLLYVWKLEFSGQVVLEKGFEEEFSNI